MEEKKGGLPKLIVILGPTASGKTDWGLRLAKTFTGEIISADSRQIYKKMDIGTAKALGEWHTKRTQKTYIIEGVRHHLIDFLDPGRTFTVAEFREKAVKQIAAIHKRAAIPFMVGGTGLYISSVVDNWHIPKVPPNKKMRRSLEEKDAGELVGLLETIDPIAAKNIDPHNKRRMIRALEVSILSGEPFSAQQKKGKSLFDTLQIGIDLPQDLLRDRIDSRIDEMMRRGLCEEVKMLRQQKYDWALPSMSGVGYRQFREYLEEDMPLTEVVHRLKRDTWQFARRQKTWFRRDPRIVWCHEYGAAEILVKDFLSQ